MRYDGTGLEVLDAHECLRLLRTQTVGRIGITSNALPVVLPVNYVVDDDQIIIRTRRGTTLAAATRNAIVAFETDRFDPDSGHGWSVMVLGIARELQEVPELAEAQAAPLARWLDPAESRHVSVSIDTISGRRLPPTGGEHQ